MVEEFVLPRKPREHLGDVVGVDETLVPGAAEGGDGGTRILTLRRLNEGLDHGRHEVLPWHLGLPPVHDHALGAWRKAAGERIDLDVQGCVILHEHPQLAQEGHTIETTAETRNPQNLVVGAGENEAPFSNANQSAVGDRGGYLPSRGAGRRQDVAGEEGSVATVRRMED